MSNKTIVVCGHGPGISDAVARRFGREGFSVALVARSRDKLEAAASKLVAQGIKAAAFATDLGDASAVKAMIGQARASLGPISIVHYNAYQGGAGDLLTATPEELRRTFDVSVTGLVAAVQAAHADLRANKGAVLVTGGGFAFYDPTVDAMATQFQAAGLAVGKAAQHKLVGLLASKLADDGVFVGEVTVLGMVKGTAYDNGHATLDPEDIAAKFWEVYGARAPLFTNFP
jgi:NADP-dependent 3-hydroxy acid dehydrogenase YdfG